MKSQSSPIYNYDEVQEVKRQALKELQKQVAIGLLVGFIAGGLVASLCWLNWFYNLIA